MSVRYFSLGCADFSTLIFSLQHLLVWKFIASNLVIIRERGGGPFCHNAFMSSFFYLHAYMSRLFIDKTNNTVKALTRLPLFLAKLHKYDFSCFLLVQNSSMAIVLLNINIARMRKRNSGFFCFHSSTYSRHRVVSNHEYY